MAESAEVPPDILARLRAVCLGLPDAYEEAAWVGIRWRVRTRTFAHVLMIVSGRPRAHARAAGADGPIVVMTFRSSGQELDALGNAGHQFFRAAWGRDDVGMVLNPDADWDEVAELVTESYCLLAPTKLVELVDRPG